MEHTADTGILVTAPTLEGLFLRAALGMRDLFLENVPDGGVAPTITKNITVSGIDHEEMLFSFLAELLYLFDGEKFLPLALEEARIAKDGFSCIATGVPFDAGKYPMKYEIKAVTYHQMKIEEVEGEWRTPVIFDI